MIDYDFIEIGTSDFRTLIEGASDDTVGISVEPIKYYLEKLPVKKNVTKVNCAIAFDNQQRQSKIYYVKDDVIAQHKLPHWLKGCNSIEDFHYQHKKLGIQDLVTIDTIDQIPIGKLLEDHRVRQVKFLKIDTEGGDCYILEHLKTYLEGKDKVFYPKEIFFESNILSKADLVQKTIDNYRQIGYDLKSKTQEDTHLILKD